MIAVGDGDYYSEQLMPSGFGWREDDEARSAGVRSLMCRLLYQQLGLLGDTGVRRPFGSVNRGRGERWAFGELDAPWYVRWSWLGLKWVRTGCLQARMRSRAGCSGRLHGHLSAVWLLAHGTSGLLLHRADWFMRWSKIREGKCRLREDLPVKCAAGLKVAVV